MRLPSQVFFIKQICKYVSYVLIAFFALFPSISLYIFRVWKEIRFWCLCVCYFVENEIWLRVEILKGFEILQDCSPQNLISCNFTFLCLLLAHFLLCIVKCHENFICFLDSHSISFPHRKSKNEFTLLISMLHVCLASVSHAR